MRATEELRRLLDERGVEYFKHEDGEPLRKLEKADEPATSWYMGGASVCAVPIEGSDLFDLWVDHCTPEQAIAATLGDDAKPCPWCGREMQEGHHDGHVWYRDDSDYIASLKRSIDALQESFTTLGGGECKFVGDAKHPPKCSACGYEPSIYECSWLGDGGYEFEGNYCPNCGARVKEVGA